MARPLFAGLVAFGAAGLVAYAVLGALIMNDWAVAAASRMPLNRAVAEMAAADQPYGIVAGIVFATLGVLLALGWGVWALLHRAAPAWVLAAAWGGILACGAPAYFFASFGNLMSVGDTSVDWDGEAAFALELPLYLASGAGAIVAVLAVGIGLRQLARSRARDHAPVRDR